MLLERFFAVNAIKISASFWKALVASLLNEFAYGHLRALQLSKI
ncbi:hypothetical protein BH11PLA2_BH11PLA2_29530 [soil metagenome]